MSITTSAQKRYATKAFDSSKKLTTEQIAALKTALRLSPSSLNYQPWHFLIVSSEKGKADVASACTGPFSYNAKKIQDAALVVVLCAKTQADKSHVDLVIAQEDVDKRYANSEIKAERQELMDGFIEYLNQMPKGDIQAWLDKQCFIALGNVLLTAADMGIDSVPMEGFDPATLDKVFNLADKGLHSVVLAAFGYHSEDDFNAKLPKSRLDDSVLFSEY